MLIKAQPKRAELSNTHFMAFKAPKPNNIISFQLEWHICHNNTQLYEHVVVLKRSFWVKEGHYAVCGSWGFHITFCLADLKNDVLSVVYCACGNNILPIHTASSQKQTASISCTYYFSCICFHWCCSRRIWVREAPPDVCYDSLIIVQMDCHPHRSKSLSL